MGRAIGFDLGSAYTALCLQDEKDIKMTAAPVMIEGNLSVSEVVFCSL